MGDLKNNMLYEIMHQLFKAEDRRIQAMIDELIKKNNREKNIISYAFIYQGNTYYQSNTIMSKQIKNNITSLAFSLTNELINFNKNLNKLNNDKVQIRQLFVFMFAQCTSHQDFRDSLPDCVANLLFSKNMPRFSEEPTFLIKNDKRKVEDYYRLLPIIEMYSVTNLLY